MDSSSGISSKYVNLLVQVDATISSFVRKSVLQIF